MIIQMKTQIWKITLVEDLKTLWTWPWTPVLETSQRWVPILLPCSSQSLHTHKWEMHQAHQPSLKSPASFQALCTRGNLPHPQPLASTHGSSFLVIRSQWLRHWVSLPKKTWETGISSETGIASVLPSNRCVFVCVSERERVCVMGCLLSFKICMLKP